MKFPFRLKDLCSLNFVVVTSVLVLNFAVNCQLLESVNSLGDGCDWTGSDLMLDDIMDRGVTPVYLRCSQGHLKWQYPRGALRVLLRLGASGREFRACLKVTPSFSGARIFLEGPRALVPLYPAHQDDDSPPELSRCFQSRDAQTALYVEATSPRGAVLKEEAAFSYHLQPMPRGSTYYNSQEDCRPCTPEELIRLYCTSDFVARGMIVAVMNNELLARSEVSARVSKVHRQINPVFKPYNLSAFEYSIYEQEHDKMKVLSFVTNNVAGKDSSEDLFTPRYQYGTVYVPLHCGAKHGAGEFLFMGRFVLDDPILTCAPRIEDWLQVQRTAIEEGTAQCSFDT